MSTKYLLIIYRAGGVFGGSRPTVIGVDKFEASKDAVSYRGFVGDELVVEFPGDTTYLLVNSSLVTSTTPIEAAKRQKAEDEELELILGKPEDMGYGGGKAMTPTNQGYL